MITAVYLTTNRPSFSNVCASVTGDHYLRAVREETVGVVCITPIFTITVTNGPSSNSASTEAATIVVTTTAATETDAITATALTRAEPTRQSQPTARLHLQSSPLPRLLRLRSRLLRLLLRLLQLLHRLLRFLPRLLLRRMSSNRLVGY